jgi:hypothetical protein
MSAPMLPDAPQNTADDADEGNEAGQIASVQETNAQEVEEDRSNTETNQEGSEEDHSDEEITERKTEENSEEDEQVEDVLQDRDELSEDKKQWLAYQAGYKDPYYYLVDLSKQWKIEVTEATEMALKYGLPIYAELMVQAELRCWTEFEDGTHHYLKLNDTDAGTLHRIRKHDITNILRQIRHKPGNVHSHTVTISSAEAEDKDDPNGMALNPHWDLSTPVQIELIHLQIPAWAVHKIDTEALIKRYRLLHSLKQSAERKDLDYSKLVDELVIRIAAGYMLYQKPWTLSSMKQRELYEKIKIEFDKYLNHHGGKINDIKIDGIDSSTMRRYAAYTISNMKNSFISYCKIIGDQINQDEHDHLRKEAILKALDEALGQHRVFRPKFREFKDDPEFLKDPAFSLRPPKLSDHMQGIFDFIKP